MHVRRFASLEELEPYADEWNRLAAGVPMRTWCWLSRWWRHYGPPPPETGPAGARLLYVLAVFGQSGKLAGVAPWYMDCSPLRGRVVRMLGTGEVCSDYLTVLSRPGREAEIAQALAAYLDKAAEGSEERDGCPRWDLLELTGIDARDRPIACLANALAASGSTVACRPGPNCWRVRLPAGWDEYLAMLSKGHRKQLRRLERNIFQRGRGRLHVARCAAELPRAMEILRDLHQQRRRALGDPGCFASPPFAAFHQEVMPLLLARGELRLCWLELDDRPVAAEYQLAGRNVIYAYQSGIDPEALDEEPGRLITLATLRQAIEQGYREVDFLRGDEPYKAHWRARPRPTVVLRVVPPRTVAQARYRLWLAGRSVHRWIKSQLRITPATSG